MERAGLCPVPHQGDDPPGPCPCGYFLSQLNCNFPLFYEEKTPRLAAAVLLARRLKAANPDAQHPGKAEE